MKIQILDLNILWNNEKPDEYYIYGKDVTNFGDNIYLVELYYIKPKICS